MRYPGAPELLKMACGENPKRVYKEQKRAPTTRMSNVKQLRDAFIKAQKYEQDRMRFEVKFATSDPAKRLDVVPPERDLGLETLVSVLRGDTLVQWHCYQADDMLSVLQVADELGFKVRTFHHALEAYKIRDILAKKQIAVATWADWYGFKMEAMDGIPENLALVQEAGGRAIVHSDSAMGIQVLNQEAAKGLAAGKAMGIPLTEDDALRWVTANAAWALGIDQDVGTLQVGRRADVVLWSENPFSVYAQADRVWIDGQPVYDRGRAVPTWSDFELGYKNTAHPDQKEAP
jgi:imidazolonepropionase-like amidohydrolase